MRFLDILVVFRLDLGQISFNLAENAFVTQQLTFLGTGFAFYDISTWACTEIKILRCEKWPMSLGFSIFGIFFRLSFFSFSFLFVAVIDLLLGLLAVKKLLSSRQAIFTMEQPGVGAENFALSFSLNFLSMCISWASFGRSFWSGHHWKDLFLLAEI